MGFFFSKNRSRKRMAQYSPSTAEPSASRPKLDASDYILRGLKGETVVRRPGSIDGQQFLIDQCTDCNIFLLDHSAQVTIDECNGCHIFVGPVAQACFVRSCEKCRLIVACQQWRTRDCVKCDVLLYCLTQPTIESSREMRFGCFQFSYKELLGQFESARLEVFHNEWSNMFNFTPEIDWGYLPSEAKAESIGFPFEALQKFTDIPDIGSSGYSVVPRTWGVMHLPRTASSSGSNVLLLLNSCIPDALKLINALWQEGQMLVLETERKLLDKKQAAQCFSGLSNKKQLMASVLQAPAIALKVNGRGGPIPAAAIIATTGGLLTQMGQSSESLFVGSKSETVEQLEAAFFSKSE